MPDEPTASAPEVPEGIDAEGLTGWFQANIPSVEPPLRFSLIAGGRSNLTFLVEDATGSRLVLRRPPVAHVLPTAHDMSREHRLLTALWPTPVPVPRPLGLCSDPSVNGAPFYVMEYVEGHILRNAADVESSFPISRRAAVSDHMADTLALVHRVDIDAVGLGDLARREAYIARQVRRWTEQYRNSTLEPAVAGARTDGVKATDDLVARVGAELSERIPPQETTTIVHGDYRLDNVVLGENGQVLAILDWELCTLGDPLADLGLLLVYWSEPGEPDTLLGRDATTAPGFLTRQDVVERYAEASGRDVSKVGFFTAFGYWKLACILQGVYVRHVMGAGGGDPTTVDGLPPQIQHLAELAAGSLGALR
jgi:aminoglycoside phosphotransferase (APT) family kinase protein